MKRIVNALYKFGYERRALVIVGLCAAAAIALPAQTLTKIHTFCLGSGCLDGGDPSGPVVQALDGDFYGMTIGGGTRLNSNGAGGTIFRIASGHLATVYNFCSLPDCADGGAPLGGLVQAKNSTYLYGVTSAGGANTGPSGFGGGTIFRVTPAGALSSLYSFCSQANCADGYFPFAGLVQASNGDYYGTTVYGGKHEAGTVFKITAAGVFQSLYSFCSKANCEDGGGPQGALVQGVDGNLYGTTQYGGASPYLPNVALYNGKSGGTVFKITPQGKLTTIYSFCSQVSPLDVCTDGESPSVLINGADGNLYGVTPIGGSTGDGTIYKLTLNGELTTLYNFCSQVSSNGECADGQFPTWLTQASDGNLYGETGFGGAGLTGPPVSRADEDGIHQGTIFKTTLTGELTRLYEFCSQPGDSEKNGCLDGDNPSTLVQATNGSFYGTGGSLIKSAHLIGLQDTSEVFRFSVGLNPFVETLPSAGAIGQAIKILGTNLSHATSVSFNGVAAQFKVNSVSEITVTIPAGAISGDVQVITPNGTLESNTPFQVLP